MTTNREKAAEIIEGYYPECPNCPVGIQEVGECPECARICKVIADALDAAGVLAPDLPAPTSHRGDGHPEWLVPELAKIYVDWGLVVFELENPDDEELTSEGAKKLALALLAAAAYAQKDETNE